MIITLFKAPFCWQEVFHFEKMIQYNLAFALCFISPSLAIMTQTPVPCQGCTYPGCQVVVTKFCTTASNIFFYPCTCHLLVAWNFELAPRSLWSLCTPAWRAYKNSCTQPQTYIYRYINKRLSLNQLQQL